MLLVMKLPLAGLLAVVASGLVGAATSGDPVSPWLPVGISGSAAIGLVYLFRKVQKDIIGEQDRRYENVKNDLKSARREALRASKAHEQCEGNLLELRSELHRRHLLPAAALTPPAVLPTDEELDAELGYTDEDTE